MTFKNNTIAILSFLAIFPASAAALTQSVYVNSTYTLKNADTHTFDKDAFRTLQAAINAVAENGTIFVAPGIYRERISITKPLSLICDPYALHGGSPALVVIDGGISTTTGTITVRGSRGAIDVTIRDCSIRGGGSGINVLENAVMTIDHNTISGYYKNGIAFGPVLLPGYGGVSGTISNNLIIGKGPIKAITQNGIQISEKNTSIITGNTILNHIYTVPGNHWATGILVHRSDGITIASNTLQFNEAGINIKQSSNSLIADNLITGNSYSRAGIMLSDYNEKQYPATGNKVLRNTIVGGFNGIWTSYVSGNIYAHNLIVNPSGNGIYTWETGENIFTENVISGTQASSRNTKAFTLAEKTANSIEEIVKKIPTKGIVLGASTYAFLNTLQSGDNNNDVFHLQLLLIEEGILTQKATGYFGQATKNALMELQKKYNVPMSGIVDKETLTILNNKSTQ